MDLNEFLSSKVKTGMSAEFSTAKTKNGEIVIANVGDKRYAIQGSVGDSQRFKEWIGTTTLIDIKKIGKYIKTIEYGFLPLIQFRGELNLKKERDEPKTVNRESE